LRLVLKKYAGEMCAEITLKSTSRHVKDHDTKTRVSLQTP
jgi:hypothetical protein